MNKKYDIAVFIGRFQPLHNAHLEIIKKASEISDKVILIIGSALQPRTYKNPFTEHDRLVMLKVICDEHKIKNVIIDYTTDSIYNDQAWAIRIQRIVDEYSINNQMYVASFLLDEVCLRPFHDGFTKHRISLFL